MVYGPAWQRKVGEIHPFCGRGAWKENTDWKLPGMHDDVGRAACLCGDAGEGAQNITHLKGGCAKSSNSEKRVCEQHTNPSAW